MIITRSPLRVTLGGGGTDLPSYYEKHEGFLIAAAIDKYIYLNIHKTFQKEFILKYSQLERVQKIDEMKHPIIKQCLKDLSFEEEFIEVTSMADIPAGTGLGSSGSFTTALIKALSTYQRNFLSPEELAESACDIEINKLGEPIGKQDQYIAAFGGVTCFEFQKNGKVKAYPLKLSSETLYNLEDHLLLFFTGQSRSASSILKEQHEKSEKDEDEMLQNLHFVKELGLKSKASLEQGRLEDFAELMNVHWEHKKKRSGKMSNLQINQVYEQALKHGALGGKLIGAGGGGFLMFYASRPSELRSFMLTQGLREVRFRFDQEGTKVLNV